MKLKTKNGPIVSSDQIIQSARELAESGGKKMVAVAGASDTDVLGALSSAHADGILDATLFGDEAKIKKCADDGQVDISSFKIVHNSDPIAATHGAVKMASEGKADVIMKGFVSTSALLKAVLAREYDLRTDNTVSHTAVLDIPGYHKLFAMTDGGMVVKPDVDQKVQILENAVLVAKALGIKPVKVALSGAVDDSNNKDYHLTEECNQVMDKVKSRKLSDVIMYGPMTFDVAVSKENARLKKVESEVAGDADIYLVSSIEECNIIAKSLINFADTVFAGVIVGAKVPVSLVSRTDTVKNKKASVSIACLVAEYYQKQGGRK